MSLDSVLVKSILKNLEVLNVFVVELCLPLHFSQTEGSRVDGIHYLDIHCSCGTLLDLCQLQLQI